MSKESPKNLEDTPETRGRITSERMLEILEEEEINFVKTEDGEAEVYFRREPEDDFLGWEHFSPSLNEKDFREHVRWLKKTYPDMVKKRFLIKDDFEEDFLEQ